MLVYPSNLCSDVELCSWFGDTFRILCGVRQGSVLSPFVFSIYVDNVIDNLRISGYGLHIGNVFAGCIVFADDIILLSCSCHSIQQLVNICVAYGKTWNLQFNPQKTQCIAFGGNNPSTVNITLNFDKLEWCSS